MSDYPFQLFKEILPFRLSLLPNQNDSATRSQTITIFISKIGTIKHLLHEGTYVFHPAAKNLLEK